MSTENKRFGIGSFVYVSVPNEYLHLTPSSRKQPMSKKVDYLARWCDNDGAITTSSGAIKRHVIVIVRAMERSSSRCCIIAILAPHHRCIVSHHGRTIASITVLAP